MSWSRASTIQIVLASRLSLLSSVFSPLLLYKAQRGSPCIGVDSRPAAMLCRCAAVHCRNACWFRKRNATQCILELSVGRRRRLSQLKTTSWPSPPCTWTKCQVGSMTPAAAPRLGCPCWKQTRDLCWWWLSKNPCSRCGPISYN